MILFIGQVQRDAREREAFQEVEYRRAFTEFAKWVGEIDDPARIPRIRQPRLLGGDVRPPRSGCAGIARRCAARSGQASAGRDPAQPGSRNRPGKAEMADLAERISKAERPILILGGTRWTEAAVEQMRHFAERAKIPVGCSFRRQNAV